MTRRTLGSIFLIVSLIGVAEAKDTLYDCVAKADLLTLLETNFAQSKDVKPVGLGELSGHRADLIAKLHELSASGQNADFLVKSALGDELEYLNFRLERGEKIGILTYELYVDLLTCVDRWR